MQRKSLRVLHVVGGRPGGGIGTYLSLATRFANPDQITHLLTCFGGPEEWHERLAASKVQICHLPAHGRWDTRLPDFLVRLTQTVEPDIVHTHGYKADCIASFAKARLRCPVVATAHGWTEATLRDRLYKRLDLIALRRCDQVIAISDHIADAIVSSGVPPGSVRRIYSGVEPLGANGVRRHQSHAPLFDRLRIEKGQLMITCVGRLSPEKGQSVLLRAFDMLRRNHIDAHLVIVGDGPQRSLLEREASRLGVSENVCFLGYHHDPAEVMRVADILVVPSLREGLSLAALEGLAVGVAVVASRVGGIPEIITHHQHGLLANPGDAVDLFSKLLTLAEDASLREALGHRGSERVSKDFTVERMVAETIGVYERAIAQRGPA